MSTSTFPKCVRCHWDNGFGIKIFLYLQSIRKARRTFWQCITKPKLTYKACFTIVKSWCCSLPDILVDNRPCPPGRVWNDVTKTCRRTSTTCVPHGDDAVPPGTCITSCSSVPEGLYQSCWSCHRFARCILGAYIQWYPQVCFHVQSDFVNP